MASCLSLCLLKTFVVLSRLYDFWENCLLESRCSAPSAVWSRCGGASVTGAAGAGLPCGRAAAALWEKQEKALGLLLSSTVHRPAQDFPPSLDAGLKLGLVGKGVAEKLVCVCF